MLLSRGEQVIFFWTFSYLWNNVRKQPWTMGHVLIQVNRWLRHPTKESCVSEKGNTAIKKTFLMSPHFRTWRLWFKSTLTLLPLFSVSNTSVNKGCIIFYSQHISFHNFMREDWTNCLPKSVSRIVETFAQLYRPSKETSNKPLYMCWKTGNVLCWVHYYNRKNWTSKQNGREV